MTIAAARAAITATLKTVAGLRQYPYEALNPEVPCAVVRFPSLVERDSLSLDSWRYEVPVRITGTMASDRAGDLALEAIVDTVVAAFEADHDLDGTISSAAVTSVDGYGVTLIGAVEYLTVTVTVEVLT